MIRLQGHSHPIVTQRTEWHGQVRGAFWEMMDWGRVCQGFQNLRLRARNVRSSYGAQNGRSTSYEGQQKKSRHPVDMAPARPGVQGQGQVGVRSRMDEGWLARVHGEPCKDEPIPPGTWKHANRWMASVSKDLVTDHWTKARPLLRSQPLWRGRVFFRIKRGWQPDGVKATSGSADLGIKVLTNGHMLVVNGKKDHGLRALQGRRNGVRER